MNVTGGEYPDVVFPVRLCSDGAENLCRDMQARVSLWCSLSGIGWPFPPREPLSKAELIEEERIRDGMMEARKFATAEDLQTPCRAVRVLVGYKSDEEGVL